MSDVIIIPVTMIIPTNNRHAVLHKTLISLSQQSCQPQEIIIIDASIINISNLYNHISDLKSKVIYVKSDILSSAYQRNQGIDMASQSYILFIDDDILFEPNCIELMWICVQSNQNIGGVNAMITNQCYHPPGLISKWLYHFFHGQKLKTYAGLCIGPAMNILPEDHDSLPKYVETEWLNSTCTLYNRAFLPKPVFDEIFTGYSMLEDLTLSLRVGKIAKLYNARTARIFHDSQMDGQKKNKKEMAKMELINRYYIMTNILKKKGFLDYFKLLVLELFFLISSSKSRFCFSSWTGKILAIIDIYKKQSKKSL